MRHPKVYDRVRKDVDSLGIDDFFDTQKQAQLHYVNAVMCVSRLQEPKRYITYKLSIDLRPFVFGRQSSAVLKGK